ncbi:hypothetical protein G7046_g6759 [Stylonectria norvegica]|nr:hypothetical protein G7046_g6759 [Stylonectria norvegica]
MRSTSILAAVAAFASVSHAWLPNDGSKTLPDKRGLSLFEPQSSDKRWLPSKTPIRGVNLGSLFVYEPWTDWKEWQTLGCSGQKSEFDCVSSTGQDRSNTAFQKHWNEYITTSDLDEMMSYGLNTIRVPLGYWFKEDLVDGSEHFPKGGQKYLSQLCGWASDRGFYIILDLHAAPGAQQPLQPFTGQNAPTAGFYNDYNYGRAVKFLEWLTNLIHTDNNLRNVGMVELVNEPLAWDNKVDSLRKTFYPNAYNAIRAVEKTLKVAAGSGVHIQMMNSLWGAGKPTEFLSSTEMTAFDDHRYIKWDSSVAVSQDAYIQKSCNDNRNADGNTIVGEWSIAVPDSVEKTDAWSTAGHKDFYTKWFSAQVHSYEKYTLGWVFWTWKTELGDDYRWGYRASLRCSARLPARTLFTMPSPSSAHLYSTSANAPKFSYHIASSFIAKDRPYDPTTHVFHYNPYNRIQPPRNRRPSARPESGHDAFFVSRVNDSGSVAFGLADGVGGWVESGVDPADFSHGFCDYMAVAAYEHQPSVDPPLTARRLMQKGYDAICHDRSLSAGGSTACVAVAAPDGTLDVANLGDSGFLQLRLNGVHAYSEPQTHAFNTPFQLSLVPPSVAARMAAFGGEQLSDMPRDADVTQHTLRHGDVLLFATDGVLDNLFNQDLLRIANRVMASSGAWANTEAGGVRVADRLDSLVRLPESTEGKTTKTVTLQSLLATEIVTAAKRASVNTKLDGPFAKEVQKHYPHENWHGGKVDDICVIIAVVSEETEGVKSKL